MKIPDSGTPDRHPADRFQCLIELLNPQLVNQCNLPPQFLKVEGIGPRSRPCLHDVGVLGVGDEVEAEDEGGDEEEDGAEGGVVDAEDQAGAVAVQAVIHLRTAGEERRRGLVDDQEEA